MVSQVLLVTNIAHQNEKPLDSNKSLSAAILLLVVAGTLWLIMPLYIGAAADGLQLNESQAGTRGFADFSGMALASILAPLWIRRIDWRYAAVAGLSVMLCGNLLSIFSSSFNALLAIRFVTDLGAGSVASIGLAALADSTKSDRNFGLAIAAQTVLGSLGLFGLPYLISIWGLNTIFVLLTVMAIAVSPLLLWLPRCGKPSVVITPDKRRALLFPLLGLLAMTLFFSNIGAVWTYIERIGSASGLSATYIGKTLAMANAIALFGALAAVWLGDRFGHFRPLLAVAVFQLLALAVLNTEINAVTYFVALCVYAVFWNFAIPYQMTVTANSDPSGRLIVLATAFHGAGAAVGPGLVAVFISPGSFIAVYSVAAVCGLLCFTLFLPLLRFSDRRGPDL